MPEHIANPAVCRWCKAIDSRHRLSPTPARTISSIDASWSTIATTFCVQPACDNIPASSRECTDASGVPIQGSAAKTPQSSVSTKASQPAGAMMRYVTSASRTVCSASCPASAPASGTVK